jgi:hypothetical protein
MPKFYHVTLIRKPGVTNEAVEEKMNLAVDWFKYSSHCWILWTTADAATWKERLSPLFRPDGRVLICKVDKADIDGFFPKGGWAFLRKHGWSPEGS